MKKIVVTGAAGFVGYHVAKALAEEKQGEIFCMVRPTSEKKFINELPVKLVEGDLRDRPSLDRILDGCDALFHIAADYRLWARNPEEIIESNVQGTENILSAAKKYGIKKVVYTSSVAAVGRPELHEAKSKEHCLGNETMDPSETHLIGPYKKSKFYAELVARKFAKEGLPLVIVNPSTPVGSHDIKPTPTGKLILDFLKRKMPAYLETGLNFVDVEDVARGHLLAGEKGKVGERYILGGKNLMLKELFDLLSEVSGLPSPKYKIPYWIAYSAGWITTSFAGMTGRAPLVPLDGVKMARELMFYDGSKAVRELGMPQNFIQGALEKAVHFFREHGYVD